MGKVCMKVKETLKIPNFMWIFDKNNPPYIIKPLKPIANS
jgi:hypothetical protein